MAKVSGLKYDNVTVSSLSGAGSTTLAKLLAESLSWDYWAGGDFMRAYAIEQGVFDKNNKFHHDATVYNEDFDRQVDFGMRQSLQTDKGRVLDSWLSGFMAQGLKRVLKVLVFCSEDAIRVDRITNRDGVAISEAKKHVFEREAKNLKKWQQLYAQEWQNWLVKTGKLPASQPVYFWRPELYDLAIDTYSNSKSETLKKTLDKLGYKQTSI